MMGKFNKINQVAPDDHDVKLEAQFGDNFVLTVWRSQKHSYFDALKDVHADVMKRWDKMAKEDGKTYAKEDQETVDAIGDALFAENTRNKFDFKYVNEAYTHMSFFGKVTNAVDSGHQLHHRFRNHTFQISTRHDAMKDFPLVTSEYYAKLHPRLKPFALVANPSTFANNNGVFGNEDDECSLCEPPKELVVTFAASVDIRALNFVFDNHGRAPQLISLSPFEVGERIKIACPRSSNRDCNSLINTFVVAVNGIDVAGPNKPKSFDTFVLREFNKGKGIKFTLHDGGWYYCRCVRKLVENLLNKRFDQDTRAIEFANIFSLSCKAIFREGLNSSKIDSQSWKSTVKWASRRSSSNMVSLSEQPPDETLRVSRLKQALRQVKSSEEISLLHLAAAAGDVNVFKFITLIFLEVFENTNEQQQRQQQHPQHQSPPQPHHSQHQQQHGSGASSRSVSPTLPTVTEEDTDFHARVELELEPPPQIEDVVRNEVYQTVRKWCVEEIESEHMARGRSQATLSVMDTIALVENHICEMVSRGLMKYLVDIGVYLHNVELVLCQSDKYGRTPLHFAVQNGEDDMLEHLFNLADELKWASQNDFLGTRLYKNHKSKIENYIKHMQDNFTSTLLAKTTTTGETPLHFAARYDRPAMIFRLLFRARALEEVCNEGYELTRWDQLNFRDSDARERWRKVRVLSDFHTDREYVQGMAAEEAAVRTHQAQTDCSGNADVRKQMLYYPTTLPQTHRCFKYRGCPCRNAKAFAVCHSASATGAWSNMERNNNEVLKGRSLALAPPQLQDMLQDELSQDQKIYRDMKDQHGRTALHIAAQMDRDLSTTVIMDLGGSAGERDAYGRPPLYYMITNIPNLAMEAIDDFQSIERSSRVRRAFLSYFFPRRVENQCLFFTDQVSKRKWGQRDTINDFLENLNGHVYRTGMQERDLRRTDLSERLAIMLEDGMTTTSKLLAGEYGRNDQELSSTRYLMDQILFIKNHDRMHREPSWKQLARSYMVSWWCRDMEPKEYKTYWKSNFTLKHRFIDQYTVPSEVELTTESHATTIDDEECADKTNVKVRWGKNRREVRSILDQIVKHQRLTVVTKDVMLDLIKSQWSVIQASYTREIIWYALFVIVWTAASLMSFESNRKDYSSSPMRQARIGVESLGVAMIIRLLWQEVKEFRTTQRFSENVRRTQSLEFLEEMNSQSSGPTWPDFYYTAAKLADEMNENPRADYFNSAWNWMDLTSYLFLTLSEVFQLVWVFSPNASDNWGYASSRFLSLGLMLSWFKVLKFLRTFSTFGPFVVILGNMFFDIRNFLVLYIVMWVPISAAFVLLLGFNDNISPEFGDMGTAMMSTFRMTMVEYDIFAEMRAADPWTTSIMMFFWLFMSALVFLNLFIAMMATTYQNVTDSAEKFSTMCRASEVVMYFRCLSNSERSIIDRRILEQLDFDTQGGELYKQETYDDEDDLLVDMTNLRNQVLERINRAHESIFTLKDDIRKLQLEGKKTRLTLKKMLEYAKRPPPTLD